MNFLDIVESIAVILASLFAIHGINSWRREMKEKRKYEVAEEVLALFYEARDKISLIRMPAIMRGGEEESSTPGLSESLQKKAISEANIIIERYQKYQKTFNRLHALLYRFKVIFGEEKTKPFYDLSKVTSDILNAARRLGSLWQRSNRIKNEKEAKIARENIDKYEAVIWENWFEPDPIDKRVQTIIAEIEKNCAISQRRKQSWISKIFRKEKN